jgi:hypothetical protein
LNFNARIFGYYCENDFPKWIAAPRFCSGQSSGHIIVQFNPIVRGKFMPVIGRFIESDLVGLQAGVNTCGYAIQSPLWYSDPFGPDVQTVDHSGQSKAANARCLSNTSYV